MKRNLLALAVVAASGAASAQSSVNLSGNVSLGVIKESGQSAKLDNAGGQSSSLTFRGTEDLGGGLRANFTLTQRLSLESGGNEGAANKRPFWQHESTVGLSGNFGAIKIGRSLTAFYGPVNASDPWGTWTVASTAALARGYVVDPAANTDGAGLGRTDAITYSSPSFGGFSAAVSLGLKNSQTNAFANNGPVPPQSKNLGSLWLSYDKGPIMISGGYEKNRVGDDIAAVLGSYDFGVAKLMAGYSHVDKASTPGAKGKNWNVGVSAPLGVVTAKAGYFSAKAEGTGIETRKLGIGGEYNLSKRTYLYSGYGRTKVDGVATTTTGFDVGINHRF